MSEQEVFDALKYHIEVDCHGNRFYYNSADLLHRTDGPAIEWVDGSKEWWINGVILTEAEFNQRVKMSEQDVFDTVK